jgi:hypothetical protein
MFESNLTIKQSYQNKFMTNKFWMKSDLCVRNAGMKKDAMIFAWIPKRRGGKYDLYSFDC